jgi:N-formylglutamate deformylase
MSPVTAWIVFHVPHDATEVPIEVRDQFVLTDEQLQGELLKMTDHHTLALFAADVPTQQVVRAPVSRLVVDVERFADDQQEPMAARGMGVVYTKTHALTPLRRALNEGERAALLRRWYAPHHEALQRSVERSLAAFGRCTVLDCHSFPQHALAYEDDKAAPRPQICIGTDEFHTPPELACALVQAFREVGLTVALNTPFSGALVPLKYYGLDDRVSAVMIEVRRDLYMNELTGGPLARFPDIAQLLRRCLGEVWV